MNLNRTIEQIAVVKKIDGLLDGMAVDTYVKAGRLKPGSGLGVTGLGDNWFPSILFNSKGYFKDETYAALQNITLSFDPRLAAIRLVERLMNHVLLIKAMSPGSLGKQRPHLYLIADKLNHMIEELGTVPPDANQKKLLEQYQTHDDSSFGQCLCWSCRTEFVNNLKPTSLSKIADNHGVKDFEEV
jgi:hypothetical protein